MRTARTLTTLSTASGSEAGQSRAAVTAPKGVAALIEMQRNLLVAERGRRLYLLKPESIDYVQAHGNYVKFGVAGNEYIKRDTIKHLATSLAGSGFVRIARSLLINIAAVLYVQRVGQGVFAFTLASGGCVHSGPSYRRQILEVLPLTKVSPGSWKFRERVTRQTAVRPDADG